MSGDERSVRVMSILMMKTAILMITHLALRSGSSSAFTAARRDLRDWSAFKPFRALHSHMVLPGYFSFNFLSPLEFVFTQQGRPVRRTTEVFFRSVFRLSGTANPHRVTKLPLIRTTFNLIRNSSNQNLMDSLNFLGFVRFSNFSMIHFPEDISLTTAEKSLFRNSSGP